MMGARAFLLLLSVAGLTSSLEPPVRGTVPFRPGPDLALVEGDVAVAVSQGGGQARHTFVTDPSNLWTNGIVFYRFEMFEWDGVEEPIFSDTIIQTPLLTEERGVLTECARFHLTRDISGFYWSGSSSLDCHWSATIFS